MPVCPQQDEYSVYGGFGLIAFASRCVVQESPSNVVIPIELLESADIHRSYLHCEFASHWHPEIEVSQVLRVQNPQVSY
jgi:hypothetical protein